MNRNFYFLTLFLVACGSPEKPDDTGQHTLEDRDQDGTSESDGDCNDQDASISPFSPEVCDGIDNDCDGFLDTSDATTYYRDADEDGHVNGNLQHDEVSEHRINQRSALLTCSEK